MKKKELKNKINSILINGDLHEEEMTENIMQCIDSYVEKLGVEWEKYINNKQREILWNYTSQLKKQGTITKEQSEIKLVNKFMINQKKIV